MRGMIRICFSNVCFAEILMSWKNHNAFAEHHQVGDSFKILLYCELLLDVSMAIVEILKGSD